MKILILKAVVYPEAGTDKITLLPNLTVSTKQEVEAYRQQVKADTVKPENWKVCRIYLTTQEID